MSVDINPEFWKPLRQNRAWFFFQSARSVLGLWCSLPVTWLAQKPDGSAIPPPWRELWSFGTDHCWAGRMGAADEAERFIEECIRDSPQIPSLKYRPRIRVPEALDSGLSTRQEQQA